jgi:ElaB/YqjD/DUF883 family membrane-anchored ribosome-binding protein
VADYACAHPMQMALVAGGLTWWLLRGRDRSDEWAGASEGWQDGDAEAYGEHRTLREKAGEYVSSARDTVSGYAASARDTAGEYASAARSTARRASASARDAWQRSSTSVDDWVHEYPLAAGAVAVAVGAAIGLSVRSTDWEDRTLGERRDQAMAQARAKARELKDTVSQRAKNVANAVEELTAPVNPPQSATSSTTGTV